MRSWWGAELIEHNPPHAVWARGHRTITMGQLRAEVATSAALLRAHGIGDGATVALHGGPSFTHLWSLLALWSLGAQVLQFPPGMAVADRRALLRLCRPRFLVSFGGPPGAFVDECSVLVRPLPDGIGARTSHCVVQFTSGTTGRPKVVGRTSESLFTEVDRMRALPGMPVAGERVAVLEGPSRSFGLIGGLLHALDVGATVLFPPLGAATAHVVLGNPGHFAALLGTRHRGALPHLRLAISSGEPLPLGTYTAFLDRFGVRIGQAYGTTETGLLAADPTGEHAPPAVGPPVPGVRLRVSRGVLEAHVPQSPYLHQPQPWAGGWMPTGDLVVTDHATGALQLCGRDHHVAVARQLARVGA
ncbi:AMP-binding protein [Actinokineospora globicatena]|uniref:AMP-binding protein n=1 Tax=Actinokineospora globicatena TaxID=103729 RepID=UPI0020A46B77|nr:class I adenylate-forming enzyme family protein [Actinokineospora globicatena]MCP2306756.1 Acyl-CoA synthetase (AMP-forming)/AMP-acid ligase II [Actinokineospora globicatena]GLW82125.1 hypothetical protein Aglo01_66060 [Actinokineospora globicatena]GLW88918.1 hypothetical protein Aglo02_65570 [Actinokineospora globicatena]